MRPISTAALLLALGCPVALGAEGNPPGPAKFASGPSATKSGDAVKITFAVVAPTDVEVAVLDAQGKVVRHLAAGVLGGAKPPPEPLKAGLAQTIEWDGKDDAGKPASGGPFKVRVGAGMAAKFRGFIGGSPYVFGNPQGGARLEVASDRSGLVYVYHVGCYKFDGTLTIQVHDASGRYLRTILPAPANAPFEKVEPFRAIKLEDDTWCFDNFGGGRFPQFYPGMGGPKQGCPGLVPVATPDDRLVLFNDRAVFFIKTDGSAPGKSYQRPLWSGDWLDNWGNPPNTARAATFCAVSPDGKTLYLAGPYSTETDPAQLKNPKWKKILPVGGIYRIKLDDPASPTELLASVGAPLKGLSVDADGNLYALDVAKGRAVVLSAEGKTLGELAVASPQSLVVHPKTGEVYALSGDAGSRAGRVALVKLAGLKAGGKELARLEVGAATSLALTTAGERAVLWCGARAGRSEDPGRLLRIEDQGAKLAVTEDLADRAGRALPNAVDRAAVDKVRNEVYVNNCFSQLYRLDGRTGDCVKLPFLGTDLTTGPDGHLYVMGGLGGNDCFNESTMGGWKRVDRDGKPVPFAGTGSEKFPKGNYARHGAGFSSKGICVSADGKVYVEDMYGWNMYWVTAYSPEGKFLGGPQSQGENKDRPDGALVSCMPNACGGLKVDRRGNIYVGVVGVPPEYKFPPDMAAKSQTYRAMTGSVVKFPPTGGRFWQASNKDSKQSKPDGPGIKLVEGGWHSTSEVFAAGAVLAFPGTAPTSVFGSCACRTPRFELDDYGRLFLPDAVTFRVRVYDAAGNLVRTIGAYGNFDSQYVPAENGAGGNGKTGKPAVAVPEIPFGCPLSVGCAERNMYVSDMINHRVVCAELSCATEETCEVK